MLPMSRKLTRTITYAMSVGLLTAMANAAVGQPAAAAVSEAYNWRNVEVNGGGFVDGIVYNASQAGLVYARTDIGGAYRLNTVTKRWVPLTDWISSGDYNLLGAESIATDPV